MRKSKSFALVLGFGVSAFCLFLALRDVSWAEFRAFLDRLNPLNIVLSMSSIWVGYLCRSARWQKLAGFTFYDFKHFYRATILGALANLILPGRLGELVRIFYICSITKGQLFGIFVSAVADRISDVFGLLIVLLGLISLSQEIQVFNVFFWPVVTAVMAMLAVFTILFYMNWLKLAEDLIKWAVAKTKFDIDFAKISLSQWTIKLLSTTCLLTVFAIAADCFSLWVLLQALRTDSSIVLSIGLWLTFAAGSMIPSAPGYVGIYQAGAVWLLGYYSIPAADAVGLATVFQLQSLGLCLLLANGRVRHLFHLEEGNRFSRHSGK